MRRRLLRPSVLAAAALAALALAGTASAKSFTLPQANVAVQVARDGSLVVDEQITYAFSGPFSGGYREIPLRSGESISDVRVSEGGTSYRPGGCTELGCGDAPGTLRHRAASGAATGSSGTTRRSTSSARSTCTTGSRASPSPTTTSST